MSDLPQAGSLGPVSGLGRTIGPISAPSVRLQPSGASGTPNRTNAGRRTGSLDTLNSFGERGLREESARALDTLPKLLRRNAQEFGSFPANREKAYGIWQSWTWAEVASEVRALALGLAERGLGPGDRLAIVGDNRPKLYWGMIAAQSLGAVPVPVYQDSVAEEMAWVLRHAGAKLAIAENQEQVDKILSVREELPELETVVYEDDRGLRHYDHERLHSFATVQEAGRAAGAEAEARLDARIDAGSAEDVCVILYTSGTTGHPKGVVLTQANVVESSRLSCEFDSLGRDEETLAYLPMAWVGDFIFSVGQSYWSAFCVSCPESRDTMRHDLREIGPTYFFAPPRIFEELLTSVMVRMEDASRLKRILFHRSLAHARRVGPRLLAGESVGFRDRLIYAASEFLFLAPLRNAIGMSRVRVGYTAGEAIGPEIFAFYRALGVNLKQLYGQTEATVFIAGQTDAEVRDDTVGPAYPWVEIRLDTNGEVLYRSPGVFREYYRNEDATADTLVDGWVRSGDAGFVEEATGHLRIVDRAKDVGRLSGGAMFSPKLIENKLKFYPEIQEAVVIGDGRPDVVAMLNIDLTAVASWAERNNVVYASYQELAGLPALYEILAGHVAEVNRFLAAEPTLAPCQIRRFLVLHKELDPDDGEITRTRKVRRRIIHERYGDLVEALYDGAVTVHTSTEVTYEDGRKGRIEATLRIAEAETFEPVRIAA